MSSPLGYDDTVELLQVGENTSPPSGQGLKLEPVPITVVCNDSTKSRINASAESWGYDDKGVVVIDGTWEHENNTSTVESTSDVLIPYSTIHHIAYHFDELQEGTNPND